MTTLRWGVATDVGRVRSSNQDRALAAGTIFAVADGMGGHVGGEVAAQLATEALEEHFFRDATAEGLRDAARSANLAVWQRSQAEEALRGMGTTLTALALVPGDGSEELELVNVGDSRAYLLRAEQLVQVTSDHSLVEELVRSGELTPQEAAVHPGRHVLTRALGVEADVLVDAWLMRPRQGDRILLCSDGLFNEMSNDEIRDILSTQQEPQKAAEALVAMATSHGGNDNVTVVVVEVTRSESHEALEDEVPAAQAIVPRTKPREQRHSRSLQAHRFGTKERAGGASPRARTRSAGFGPLTLRTLAFCCLVLVVLLGGVGVIYWYAHSSYFVTLVGARVVIERGRPGGVLWFSPVVAEQTNLTSKQVASAELPALRSGVTEPSLSSARSYVQNLREEYLNLPLSPSRVSTATSTTS